MQNLASTLARAYFTHCPIEKGKWRMWTAVSPYLGHRTGEVDVELRYDLRARLNLGEYMQRFVYYWGRWEPNEVWVLQQLLRPGDTFVDAGANFGYFTMLGARLVGPTGHVFAFEPTPQTADWLRRNVALNGSTQVEVHQVAVSDAPGTVRISKPSDLNSGVNSIRAIDGALAYWDVPAVRLDDVIPAGQHVRLLKVDIEGAELMLAKGFRQHMTDGLVAHVLCEVHDNYLRELGSSSQAFFDLMASYGYGAYAFSGERFKPWPRRQPETAEERDQVNVLFSREVLAPQRD